MLKKGLSLIIKANALKLVNSWFRRVVLITWKRDGRKNVNNYYFFGSLFLGSF